MDLITLAQWYFDDHDLPSMLGFIYLIVALKKPPAPDDVGEVRLGAKILRRRFFFRRRVAWKAQHLAAKSPEQSIRSDCGNTGKAHG